MAKVVSKIAAVFYELVGVRISRTIHGGRNAASVFHGLLESMLFRTFVPGKWHFRRDSMDDGAFLSSVRIERMQNASSEACLP